MITINEPIVLTEQQTIKKDITIFIQGNPETKQRQIIINVPIYESLEATQPVKQKSVALTGDDYNEFYTEWLSDKDILQLLQTKGIIPLDAELPDGDWLN
jgi:DNA-binding ferritin-like protein (Dps family)